MSSSAPKSKGAGKWSVDDYGYMPTATGLGGTTGTAATAAGPGSRSGSRGDLVGGSRAGSVRDLKGGGK